MKVAIASQDLTRIDAHLGWARHLMIYEVDAEGYRHLAVASFPPAGRDATHAGLAPRLAAMEGCRLVFLAETGPEGERGLARLGATPIRKFAGQPVALALDALRDGMREQSLPWLRRAEQRYRRESLDG